MPAAHEKKLTIEAFADSGFKGFRVRVDAPSRGIPTPSFAHGRVYFGGGYGSYEVYALEARTGAQVWQLRTTDDGPTAVTVAGRYAAYNTESCTVEVVDAFTGERVWHKWLGDPLLSQPAIFGGRVLMSWPNAGRHVLGAFELTSGRPLWEAELDHDVISAPIVADEHVFVATYEGDVRRFDLASGRGEWRREMRATSAPWVVGDDVFVSQRAEDDVARPTAGKPERRDDADEAMPTERTARMSRAEGGYRGGTATKPARYYHQSWAKSERRMAMSLDSSVGFSSSPASAKMDRVRSLIGESSIARTWRHQGSRPVVADGVLYETTGDRLEARNVETHDLLWAWQGEEKGGNRALTPPAVANGRVLAGTADGRLLQWDAATGAVRFDVRVGGGVHWQPVMSQGRIAVGLEDGSLVVFETGDVKDDGWPMWGGGPGHNGLVEDATSVETAQPAPEPEHWRRPSAA
jgi:Ca-activated chloride channel family protein